jgi:hypothetical protein
MRTLAEELRNVLKECFTEALWTLAKVCRYPKGTFWRKCCINSRKVIYFYVTNQCQELLEANSTIGLFMKRLVSLLVTGQLNELNVHVYCLGMPITVWPYSVSAFYQYWYSGFFLHIFI